MKEIIIITGKQGIGKSTKARELSGKNSLHICTDISKTELNHYDTFVFDDSYFNKKLFESILKFNKKLIISCNKPFLPKILSEISENQYVILDLDFLEL